MVKAFEDTAFTLAPGSMSMPFKTQFGWHVLKVDDRKGEGDSLQVKARHILLRVKPGRDTLDSLRILADDFMENARDSGFNTVASRENLETGDTYEGTRDVHTLIIGRHITGENALV